MAKDSLKAELDDWVDLKETMSAESSSSYESTTPSSQTEEKESDRDTQELYQKLLKERIRKIVLELRDSKDENVLQVDQNSSKETLVSVPEPDIPPITLLPSRKVDEDPQFLTSVIMYFLIAVCLYSYWPMIKVLYFK
jgi:hypothetical protein